MDTVLLICDIQTRFRPVIHGYDHVVATTNKMLKMAKLFGFPVVVTTQNTKALGPVDPDLDLASLGDLHLKTIDKKFFSMYIPEVRDLMFTETLHTKRIILVGIESHICVLQTALSLLSTHPELEVYVVADAVSSCNAFEIPFAFDTMRQAGVKVLSSESLGFLLMRDASLPTFKEFSGIIKESKDITRAAGETLLARKFDLKSSL